MKKPVNFNESQTLVNLARSYASECMEGAKYQWMAQKAEQQELEYLKTILKMLAKHEMSHAKLFWDYITKNSNTVLNNIDISAGYPFETGSLQDDLKYSSDNENELYDHIYPAFAKIAKDEGFDDIAKSFKLVAQVEDYHSKVLQELHCKMKNKALYKSNEAKIWQCSKCGYQQNGKTAFKVCPLCDMPQGYVEIELPSKDE